MSGLETRVDASLASSIKPDLSQKREVANPKTPDFVLWMKDRHKHFTSISCCVDWNEKRDNQ
jgi:hypothetical protein